MRGRKPAAAFDLLSWCELDFVFVVQDASGMSAVRTARAQVFLTPKSHQESAEIIGSATAIFTKALKTLGWDDDLMTILWETIVIA